MLAALGPRARTTAQIAFAMGQGRSATLWRLYTAQAAGIVARVPAPAGAPANAPALWAAGPAYRQPALNLARQHANWGLPPGYTAPSP